MLRPTSLAVAAALVVLASSEAYATGGHGCAAAPHGHGNAPAYTSRYHGPAGYGRPRRLHRASGAVYRSPQAYVVYEPPYAAYSRPCGYFYAGLGNRRWLPGR